MLNGSPQVRHGFARRECKAREYGIWCGIKDRCTRKNNKSYENYGGRGIGISDRWLGEDGFLNFIHDMGPCPTSKHSIDRYPDKNGNYEPSNCRWATRKEQSRNRRNVRSLTKDGITKTLPEWAEELGIPRKRISDRLRRGCSDEEALLVGIDPLGKRGHLRGQKRDYPAGPKSLCKRQKAAVVPISKPIHRQEISIGDRFYKRVVIANAGIQPKSPGSQHKIQHWRVLCDCGEEEDVRADRLKRGEAKSCGCLRDNLIGELNLTHGHSRGNKRSPELNAWTKMRERCSNPNDKRYKDYGGRGITVCKKWDESFEEFLKDVGPRPGPEFSLERKDVNKGYEKGNVCWADAQAQARNKQNSFRITIKGLTLALVEWCERTGVPYHTAWHRIRNLGWSPEKALGLDTSKVIA